MLGSKQTPGLVDCITDEVFARYDQRTCTVSVSVEELYCVSTAAGHAHSTVMTYQLLLLSTNVSAGGSC